MESTIAQPEAPKLTDVVGACYSLSLGRSKVISLIMSGELKSIKIGPKRLIPKSAIDECIASKLAE